MNPGGKRVSTWPHRTREGAQEEADQLNVAASIRPYDEDPRPYAVRAEEAELLHRDRPPARPRARRDLASLALGGLAGAALGAIGTSTYVGLRRSKEGPFVLPAYHEPGMRVPRGGTSCANCRYVFYPPDGKPHCAEPHFVAWNKGTRIPVDDAREYCSDWWQPTREAARQMELQARRRHVPRTRSAGAGRRDTR